MTTPELIQYVKNEVAKGSTREVISGKLKMQGWTDLDVLEVFNAVNQSSSESIHPVQNPVTPATPVTSFGQTPLSSQPVSLNQYPLHNQNMNSTVNPVLNTNMNPVMGPAINSMSGLNTMQMRSSLSEQPKSGKKFLKYFITILVLLLLLIGGALAYASGYFLTTSKLFSQMTDSSKNNKTVKFDFNMNVDASAMKIPEGSISLGTGDAKTADFSMTGAFDMTDTTKLKFDSSYLFKMGKIDAGIAVRAIDGALYLNLTKGPDLGFFSLKPFENRWISIPMTDKEGKLDATNPLLSASPVNSSFLNSLTDEQKQHITDIVKKASLIKITKKHLPEMIDGSLSYHISFDLDKVGIVSFLTELTDYMKSLDKSNDSLAELQPTDYSKSLDSISSFSGEFWVGIFDKLPHKMVINSTMINPEKPEDGDVKVLATLLYKDWNKPVTVEVPDKVVTIEELMKELFGGMMGGGDVINNPSVDTQPEPTPVGAPVVNNTPSVVESKSSQEDSSKKSIISSMRAQAELYYDGTTKNTYKGFCSAKTTYGAYSLATQLPKGSTYKCNDLATSWAAWVKLSTNEYFCADNTGASNTFISLPSDTSCPKQ